VFEDGAIYIHSLPGQKINAMRAAPEVCLQADQITNEYRWRSSLAFGQYEEITEPKERERYLKLLFQKFPHLTPVEALQAQTGRESLVFRIRVERVTGVAEG
jgi:nitroimidazol reductase NimA-like FMN-containing flavoprotein (pyridoxamine 5'-phosphate oxidase superfamily)